MVTVLVSSDCVAAILKGGPLSPEEIRLAVSVCLEATGRQPWEELEAEVYRLGGRLLPIARPRPPLRRRIKTGSPRLKRG